jgi:hypothetical protein
MKYISVEKAFEMENELKNKFWESVKDKCSIDYITPFCVMTKDELEKNLQTLTSIIRKDTGCEWCTIEIPQDEYEFWVNAYGSEENLQEMLNKYKVVKL